MFNVYGSGMVTINGNVTVANGQDITIRAGGIDYTGTLNTGFAAGTVHLETSSNSINVGLGGTSLSNTEPFAITTAELQSITTGGLYIETGPVTVFSNLDVSSNNLTYVEVRTNWSGTCNCSPYQDYTGASYSVNVGTTAALLIDAAQIITGSIRPDQTSAILLA